MDLILETKDLCKSFKKQQVVKNVSLQVRRAAIYGLLGPNGSGKSTILKMISGMIKPLSGEIFFDDHKWCRKDLASIGILVETPAIYDNLTAYENLKVRALTLDIPEERIDEVLKLVDLENTGKKCAGKFSLGMKQRLGIAVALLNNPKLLILDEPTNGLDPIGIKELRKLIRLLAECGMTVIISSHILSEIEHIADYIGIIYKGVLGYQEKNKEGQNLEELFTKVIENVKVED